MHSPPFPLTIFTSIVIHLPDPFLFSVACRIDLWGCLFFFLFCVWIICVFFILKLCVFFLCESVWDECVRWWLLEFFQRKCWILNICGFQMIGLKIGWFCSLSVQSGFDFFFFFLVFVVVVFRMKQSVEFVGICVICFSYYGGLG